MDGGGGGGVGVFRCQTRRALIRRLGLGAATAKGGDEGAGRGGAGWGGVDGVVGSLISTVSEPLNVKPVVR